MKNIIKIVNLNINKHFKRKLTIDEYGFIYYLFLSGNDIFLNVLLEDLNIDLKEFKDILQSLSNKKIMAVKIINTEYVNVIWELIFSYDQDIKISSTKSYEKLFLLDEFQKKEFDEINDSKMLFLKLYDVYKNNKHKYDLVDYLVIETENDYIKYLEASSPLSILHNNQIFPDVKEVSLLFSLIYEKDINIPMINFLIDYVISTSKYKNFSINYFLKILQNWQKNKINNLNEAMNFIKETKIQKNEQKNKYTEPKWDIEYDNIKIEEELLEIEQLLKKNEIK